MLIRTFKQMAALVIIGAMTLSQVAEAAQPQRRGFSSNLRSPRQSSAKDAPKPTAKPTVWLKYINEDIKAPTPRPKGNRYPQPGRFGTSNAPAAKDAPKPTAKPTVWLKYINEDIKAPTPRPKGNRYPQRGRFGTSNAPAAKDAPKPTDKPTVWLEYIGGDIKPKPRPKPGQESNRYPQRGRFGTSNAPAAKDAPKPTDKPTVWLKYIGEDIKAPKPRPKPGQASNRYPQRGRFGSSNAPAAKDAPKPTDENGKWRYFLNDINPKPRPKSGQAGNRNPQRVRFGTSNGPSRQIPTNRYYVDYKRPGSDFRVPPPRAQKPLPPTFPRDSHVPYVHPTRDLKPRKRTR